MSYNNSEYSIVYVEYMTASAKGHEYSQPTEELTRGHIPMNGFTDRKIISDARYRHNNLFLRYYFAVVINQLISPQVTTSRSVTSCGSHEFRCCTSCCHAISPKTASTNTRNHLDDITK